MMVSFINSAKDLWKRLTEPHPSIHDFEQRRKARLLSALLLALLLVSLFNFLSSIVADYKSHSPSTSAYVLIGVISNLLLAMLYRLSRTPRYKLTGVLTLVLMFVATLAIGRSLSDAAMAQILPYLSVAVLLCSMLFSLRTTIIYAIAVMVGALLFPLFVAVPYYLDFFYPVIFVGMMTAMIAVAVRQRDLIELDRQTVQKKIEDALRESEGHLRSLVTSMSDLVFAVDLEGRFLFYHAPIPTADDTPVVSMKEYVGYRIRDTLPATFAELLEQTIEQVTKTLTTQPLDYSLEVDGEMRSFSARLSPLITDEMKLIGVTIVSRDITEAVRARHRQVRLLEFDKLTRTITNSFFQSDDPDSAINEMLRQIGEFMNVQRIQIFEFRNNDTLLDCIYEWYAPDRQPIIQLLKHFELNKNMPSLLPMLSRDGIISIRERSELPQDMLQLFNPSDIQNVLCLPFQVERSLRGFIALLDNESVREWLPEEVGTIRTIAERLSRVMERERSQLALVQARDAALRSARLKSEFMSNMSHEIRTPMTGLLGMLELLLETTLADEQREFADTAFSSAHNLLAILDDILNFSKIEAGRVVLEAKAMDPRSIVNDVKNALSTQADKKLIGFDTIMGADVPAQVYMDPTRVRQVLTNLANNAIKFTSQGRVTICVQHLGTVERRTQLRFEVQDTGIGIAPDLLDRIFESFVQADGTTTRKYGGTGLGLAICKQLVQLMGGEIEVKSEPGQGSTFGFTLTLPVVGQKQDESPFTQFAKLHLLVADSDSVSRHVVTQQLRLWGANVLELTSQNELLPALSNALNAGEPINVVFFHGTLLPAEQIKLITEIRNSLKDNAPRLVNLDDAAIQAPSAQYGFDDHLHYPLNQSELYDLLLGTQVDMFESGPVLQPEKQSQQKPIRVLVADDNNINQQIVSKALRLEKIQVDVAKNGEEALSFFAKNQYDLILMDVHMPSMDGLEATRIIRAMGGEGSQIPIIALTASVLPDETQHYLEAGMNAVLGKPFSVDQLRSEVHKWLVNGTAIEQHIL